MLSWITSDKLRARKTLKGKKGNRGSIEEIEKYTSMRAVVQYTSVTHVSETRIVSRVGGVHCKKAAALLSFLASDLCALHHH